MNLTGPSLDMQTIRELPSATTFVETPGVQQFGADMYAPKQVVYTPDVSNTDDENDLSLDDIMNKAKEFGQGAMNYLGMGNSPAPKPVNIPNKSMPSNVSPVVTKDDDKSLDDLMKEYKAPAVQNIPSQSPPEKVKQLQTYMSNPDQNLQELLGDSKYNGPVDGKVNDETEALIKELEMAIAHTIDSDAVYGVVLKTDINDVKEAVKNVVAYRKYVANQKFAKLSLDDRFCVFSKMIKIIS